MSFYLGLPLIWPDGKLFVTICVLDKRDNSNAILYRDLLREFRQVIESDLALLVEQGFRVEQVQPVDMFPQTPHVENVVRLTFVESSRPTKPRVNNSKV